MATADCKRDEAREKSLTYRKSEADEERSDGREGAQTPTTFYNDFATSKECATGALETTGAGDAREYEKTCTSGKSTWTRKETAMRSVIGKRASSETPRVVPREHGYSPSR